VLDPLLLSRIQFGMTVGFHFLFPPLTIGLAWLLVVVEGLAWRREDELYERAGRFFGKVLGLTFAVGVATGIVMEFQFGTNWAEYAKFVGDIFGAPLAAEAVIAFFLESTFLGLYLFGRGRVSRRVHFFSIVMVAIGATISAFWILVANSWQQTPAGYELNAELGRAELTDFFAAVFNPSTLPRFIHTMMAALVAGAFLMMGISAVLLLRDRAAEVARRTLRISVLAGLAFSLLTLFPSGHEHARQVARTQPAKFASMEGLIEGRPGAPLVVAGRPMDRPPGVHSVVEIPGLLSWLAFGDVDAHVEGIKDLQAESIPTPPFAISFASFHTMVGLGMIFIAVTALGGLLLVSGRLERSRWYLRALPWLIPLPLLACQFGWLLAELGRQPWVVYGIQKTADAYSGNVTGGEVLFSLLLFAASYLALGGLYVFLLVRRIRQGPEPLTAGKGTRPPRNRGGG
jgi:cytochrome d ubiquinol oxidase subunit I